jgi:hypothetical protein
MISLLKNINTKTKPDPGWSGKFQSDRFLDPNEMSCPVWTQRDLMGREADANSFRDKTAGCNSATDRVSQENKLRSSYYSNVGLSSYGVDDVDTCMVPLSQIPLGPELRLRDLTYLQRVGRINYYKNLSGCS